MDIPEFLLPKELKECLKTAKEFLGEHYIIPNAVDIGDAYIFFICAEFEEETPFTFKYNGKIYGELIDNSAVYVNKISNEAISYPIIQNIDKINKGKSIQIIDL